MARYAVLCAGAEILSSGGAALQLNDVVIGYRVARYAVLCIGAAALSSSGAAYIFNDMVTGALRKDATTVRGPLGHGRGRNGSFSGRRMESHMEHFGITTDIAT